ncbi:MAG: hypothetical protein LBR19_05155 [Bifidobacteriaceae bacterium]|nr:hypothetical protein [Bifidobacteriaceae bacterium]
MSVIDHLVLASLEQATANHIALGRDVLGAGICLALAGLALLGLLVLERYRAQQDRDDA